MRTKGASKASKGKMKGGASKASKVKTKASKALKGLDEGGFEGFEG